MHIQGARLRKAEQLPAGAACRCDPEAGGGEPRAYSRSVHLATGADEYVLRALVHIQGAPHSSSTAVEHMGVDHGGAHVGMAE